jgi:ketosteroid isomerase-like protein
MSAPQAIADRLQIQALRGEFTDASMMRDWDRFASLFTHDGAWRIPDGNVELVGREEIRAGIARLRGLWDSLVQTTHAGTIQLAGDTAVGCASIAEFGRLRDGSSYLGCAVDHDRYQRTPDGWKFTERVYEVSYLDTTPLAGSAPSAARAFADGDARRGERSSERAGGGRPPLAVGPVVAVADAGRITEVDFVLDRRKLTRLSAHHKEENA